MLGVLILGVLEGIVVGAAASLVEVLRRAALPHSAVLGRLEGETTTYRDVESYADAETRPGLIVYRFDAPIFFANADVFRDQVLRLVDQAEQPVNEVIVNAEAIYDVDTTGIEMLGRLRDDLEARNVRLTFARVRTTLRALMRRTGLEDRLGAHSFSLRVEDAAAAYEARRAP